MQTKIIVLEGRPSISSFRLKKWNEELNDPIVQVKNVYVIEAEDGFIADKKLMSLLGAVSLKKDSLNDNQLIVAPRRGTISPWSTKATEILHNCEFNEVIRVEHGQLIEFQNEVSDTVQQNTKLFDRMVEELYLEIKSLQSLFDHQDPKPVQKIDLSTDNLNELDRQLGLALSSDEKEYLIQSYEAIQKDPSDAELMMFAQANSEHCRHKIFNAQWVIDGVEKEKSLFSMIRNTEAKTPLPAISAYSDNSAVFAGGETQRWVVDSQGKYQLYIENTDTLIKVETHNHPTAISPFPGAATGSGGEIRDEAATGQGGRPKAGLTGFSVSHLHIPSNIQPWEENTIGKPDRISSSLQIMLEAPLGGAAFNNEFGRPNICGYFRSLEIETEDQQWRGYHKPIMLAGGMGFVSSDLAIKNDTQVNDYLVVLGGPAMLIGLGGGAASSMTSGSSCEDLDFASVQRGNPEMERRCQEVIDSCTSLAEESPIRSIHDVGAGGLSNAMPELLDDAGLGGVLELRNLQIDTPSMSPMEIWCNESQERYVISIKADKLELFESFCKRERCPFAVLGRATKETHLKVTDSHFNNNPVDIPMDLLLGKTPKTLKQVQTSSAILKEFEPVTEDFNVVVKKVLSFPTVASKKYLITIGDRTVSGLVHRDQMVGPWQVPVADCGVTLRDYHGYAGEAMAIGEKAPLALLDGASSARMAVAEAIMNLAGNNIGELSKIKLSANWMAASGKGREDQVLFDAVHAIGEELCPQLGIGIPVGKDSLSMNTQWDDKQVTAPVSLIVSAFSSVQDIRKSITPYFDRLKDHKIVYVDLANGNKRMGGSCLAQVYSQMGQECPNLESVELMKEFWSGMQKAISKELISAYHDISDGGLFVALTEMAIASQSGMKLNLDSELSAIEIMFSEELGAVVAIQENNWSDFLKQFDGMEIFNHIYDLGASTAEDDISISIKGQEVFNQSVFELEKTWSKTSALMAGLRDNPEAAEQEAQTYANDFKGLNPKVEFEFDESIVAPFLNLKKPKVAILREQGVNGQKEMAMAFYKAGFESHDVHMQDLMDGRFDLKAFQGIAACGGFSYGDVLGAGRGWANSILFHNYLRDMFAEFFNDASRFALGVCNGCQMMSNLKDLIPGAENWPQFLKNKSEQFEARFSSLRIHSGNSVFFQDMDGSEIPVAIAHGEGRVSFTNKDHASALNVAAQYIENDGKIAVNYPFNPNGSEQGIAAVSNTTGNVMIMMPHPERVFRSSQMSYAPKSWGENSPWMRMFYNARKFVS